MTTKFVCNVCGTEFYARPACEIVHDGPDAHLCDDCYRKLTRWLSGDAELTRA